VSDSSQQPVDDKEAAEDVADASVALNEVEDSIQNELWQDALEKLNTTLEALRQVRDYLEAKG
jgi:hypothetical protein